MGQEQTKAARLGWREGAKAREAGPGNTGSEQLGLARSEWVGQSAGCRARARPGPEPGQRARARATTEGPAEPCPNKKTAPAPRSQADGVRDPKGLQCRTAQSALGV